jgi:hypothetical protein
MINLSQLINTTPLPQVEKDKLFSLLPTLSEEGKIEITNLCWKLIIECYVSNCELKQSEYIYTSLANGKEINNEDIKKIENELFNELARKLEALESKDKMQHIREQLGKYQENRTRNPLPPSAKN